MEIEAQHRLVLVTDTLEKPAFRGDEIQRVAVDVDGLGVAPLVDLRAVGVEHRDQQEGEALEDGSGGRLSGALEKEVGDIQQGRCGRGLVAVHLRPEQDLLLATSEGQHPDGAS